MFLPQETRPENYLGNGVRQIRPTLRRFCVRTSWGKTRITIFVCLNAHYRASHVLEDLGWVDLDLGEFPRLVAATVATYCPSRMVEHSKSKSTAARPPAPPCNVITLLKNDCQNHSFVQTLGMHTFTDGCVFLASVHPNEWNFSLL